MTVRKHRDERLPSVFEHRIADIRGGVGIVASELGGSVLLEGTPLSRPTDGLCHVVKTAQLVEKAESSSVKIKVAKGHHFRPGDVVMAAVGAKASAVASIDRKAKAHDVLTLSAALGEIPSGGFLAEATAATTGTDSALKYAPFALAGTTKPVRPDDNLDEDAWIFAVTRGNALPDFIAEHLPHIVNL